MNIKFGLQLKVAVGICTLTLAGILHACGTAQDAATEVASAPEASATPTTTPDPGSTSNNSRQRTNGTISAVAYDASGNLYLGGAFTRVNVDVANGAIQLDPTTGKAGADLFLAGFGPVGSSVRVAIALSGGGFIIGGTFTTYRGASAKSIAKIDANGNLDTTFSPPGSNGFNSDVYALAVSGTSVYVGGDFDFYRGVSNSSFYIAKLDLTSGAIDTTFSPVGGNANGFNGTVSSLAIAGTSIYVGGGFDAYRGVSNSANNLAKLDLTSGAIDTTFSPAGATSNGTNSYVSSLALSGTSLYVGGYFTDYKGVANSANRLAKLNLTSGAIDTTFSPVGATSNGFDSGLYALLVSGTSLYAGGDMSNYKGVANSANRLAKLDLTSGAIDTTFSPAGGTSNGFDAGVYAFAMIGTSLYVGGDFTAFKGVANSALYLAKLDLTSGAIDTTFQESTAFDSDIVALAATSTTLVAGGYTNWHGGTLVNNLAKFDSHGNLDTTFSPAGATSGMDGEVRALALSGTSLYVGGEFTGYKGVANSANHLAKLDLTSGAIDTAFSPAGGTSNGVNSSVYALAASSSSLYVGGNFTAYKGVANSANKLAKLDLTSGAIDTTFSPAGATSNGFNNNVSALAVSSTSLYAGGSFSNYKNVSNSANRLAKLDLTSGAIDTTFSPPGTATSNGFTANVLALAVSSTSLYVGGSFSSYKGVANSALRLAKLDLTSGAIDTTFSPAGAGLNGMNGTVASLAVSGTSLYAGGGFINYKNVANSANYLAKLDLTSGAIDTTFSPAGAGTNGFDSGTVSALAVTSTGLSVGGDFKFYRATTSRNYFRFLDLTSGAPLD